MRHVMIFLASLIGAIFLPTLLEAASIAPGFDFMLTQNAVVALPIPGNGTIPVSLVSFPYPPGPLGDPTALFPLPILPPSAPPLFQVTWVDEHGNNVGPSSAHKVQQVITPNPLLGPYDTIVQRTDAVPINGMGATATTAIQIRWLSLRSDPSAPVNVPGIGLADIYVGLLNTDTQIPGKMKLTSTVSDGSKGLVDIGKLGVTTDDPNDPNFLGLPVKFKVDVIRAGELPIPANVALTITDFPTAIFHGATISNSGVYTIVPEPSSLVLLGMGGVGIGGLAWRRKKQAV